MARWAVKTPPFHGGNTGSSPVRSGEAYKHCLYAFLFLLQKMSLKALTFVVNMLFFGCRDK